MASTRRASLLLPLLALVAGCPAPQTPYSFVATADPAHAVDAATRALALQGYEVGKVDRRAGIVTSKWATYGMADAQGVFVERVTIVITPAAVAGQGSQVTVRMDVKHCPPGGFTVGDVEVQGTCTPLDGIFPAEQQKINALGPQVQAALGATTR